jgi:hypothetical protein
MRSAFGRDALVLLVICAFAVSLTPARAATVRALPLPPGMTINPQGQRVLMRAVEDGRVVGTAEVISGVMQPSSGRLKRIVVWDRRGQPDILDIPSAADQNSCNGVTEYLGAISSDGTIYANVERTCSGAYTAIFHEIIAYHGAHWRRVIAKECVTADTQGSQPIAETVADDGALGVTLVDVGPISLDMPPSTYAPSAGLLLRQSCASLGHAVLRAARGRFAAGFREYLGDSMVPDYYNPPHSYVAVRWWGSTLRELGPGVALDVASDGIAVGANSQPGFAETNGVASASEAAQFSSRHQCCDTYAVMWNLKGWRITVTRADYSVAYAIDDHHRVVGALEDEEGAHFAFVWERGVLRRLDDIVREPAWRFEAAYGFAPAGGIIGIGTLHGVPTAFVVYL